jgi:hypothetical protein
MDDDYEDEFEEEYGDEFEGEEEDRGIKPRGAAEPPLTDGRVVGGLAGPEEYADDGYEDGNTGMAPEAPVVGSQGPSGGESTHLSAPEVPRAVAAVGEGTRPASVDDSGVRVDSTEGLVPEEPVGTPAESARVSRGFLEFRAPEPTALQHPALPSKGVSQRRRSRHSAAEPAVGPAEERPTANASSGRRRSSSGVPVPASQKTVQRKPLLFVKDGVAHFDVDGALRRIHAIWLARQEVSQRACFHRDPLEGSLDAP